jgi:hypothetical protein
MKTGLKIFLKVIIALILIVPLLAYSLSVIMAILTFAIALAISPIYVATSPFDSLIASQIVFKSSLEKLGFLAFKKMNR